MTGNKRNGNISKGNKGKKNRRRIRQFADCNEDEGDMYARVYKLPGGEHLEVELLEPDDTGKKIVMCNIPGRFRKKVWFRQGNLLVLRGKFSDTIYDLKGRVNESELGYVRKLFDKSKVEDTGYRMGDECDDSDDDEKDTPGAKITTKDNTSNDDSDNEWGDDDDVAAILDDL